MTQYQSLYQRILHTLDQSSCVLLISHRNPDGDTLGANFALARYLRSRGKQVVSFCMDKPRSSYFFLPEIDRLTTDQSIFYTMRFDLIIVLDCDLRYSGVDHIIGALDYPYTLITIDHHFTNNTSGDINLVVCNAASTTVILYDLFVSNGMSIDRLMALYLLTGIVYDTDCFLNPATDSFALEAASKLLLLGVRISPIVQSLRRNKSLDTMRLWGRVLSRLKKNERTGFATTLITRQDMIECNIPDESTDGISNFLNNLGGVSAVLILKDLENGYVKGSLRTTKNLVDVSEYAKIYGGGGHRKAAGFMVKARVEECVDGWELKIESSESAVSV